MAKKSEDVSEMTFEESLAKLNEYVKQLEEGNLDLDKSMEIYQKAIVVRDRCKQILDENDRKIQKLMETADSMKIEEFSPRSN